MCVVLQELTVAHQTATDALATAETGGAARADQLAEKARVEADDAEAKLQTITNANVQRGPVWQALLEAYLRVGQGANALLMDDPRIITTGEAIGELRRGAEALTEAGTLLDGC
jgi:hypothetical protein